MKNKKVYENSMENAERFINNGMHKETDKNELAEGILEVITKQVTQEFHTTHMSTEGYVENKYRKIFDDDIEEDSDLHLGLIEEDEDDMKRYNARKILIREIVTSNDDIEN